MALKQYPVSKAAFVTISRITWAFGAILLSCHGQLSEPRTNFQKRVFS
jgi:hypothetical protein